MEKLLPDRLKELWHTVDELHFTREQFHYQQERMIDEYKDTWEKALIWDGHEAVKDSLLAELGAYVGCTDLAEMQRRCLRGSEAVEEEWRDKVDTPSSRSIERFYDTSQAYLYDLTWWHTVSSSTDPLAYVAALHFAKGHGCHRYLDFGAGIGSGGILFARHGFEVALADISSSLLDFSRWRFARRGLSAQIVDLKQCRLPVKSFDFVSAMDVFEHLVDPVATVAQLAESLAPRGFIFGRFDVEPDDDRPQHIVHDFDPVFRQFETLGFKQVWRDEWLWGHQVFQTP